MVGASLLYKCLSVSLYFNSFAGLLCSSSRMLADWKIYYSRGERMASLF